MLIRDCLEVHLALHQGVPNWITSSGKYPDESLFCMIESDDPLCFWQGRAASSYAVSTKQYLVMAYQQRNPKGSRTSFSYPVPVSGTTNLWSPNKGIKKRQMPIYASSTTFASKKAVP